MTDKQLLASYRNDWIKFAENVLGISTLDEAQKEIIRIVQNNQKTIVRSGNARGKDFVAAVISLCFLYLYKPSKVICTAPTSRQVNLIMMAEISKLWNNANVRLGGRLLTESIKFDKNSERYLVGFKAGDKQKEAWQGFHSPNMLVICTEASGLPDDIFESIEGILTGSSKLLLVTNPMHTTGETYKATTDKRYKSIRLNSMDAPNVINYFKVLSGEITENEYKKNKIPGQVDWAWVNDKVGKNGWSYEIKKDEFNAISDFSWNNKYYRALDPFRVRVLGEFPTETSDVLIPLSWIEASHKRWLEFEKKQKKGSRIVGVDIAGMGRDKTVMAERYTNYIANLQALNFAKTADIHMQVAGSIKNDKKNNGGRFMIDTVGEGAGVFSRLAEQQISDCYSCKGSHSAKGLTDYFELKEFKLMRDYIHWVLRDALDPKCGFNLMLPPCKELDEELMTLTFTVKSNGIIKIKDKKDIKKDIGRSPDFTDAITLTFTPI